MNALIDSCQHIHIPIGINGPSGKASAGTGASSCLDCEVGRYASSDLTATCSPAAAGRYVNTTGATTEQPCAAGTYSSSPGLVVCQSCPAGRASVPSQSSCAQGDKGSYSNGGLPSCESWLVLIVTNLLLPLFRHWSPYDLM
jgi:hypothetical protein